MERKTPPCFLTLRLLVEYQTVPWVRFVDQIVPDCTLLPSSPAVSTGSEMKRTISWGRKSSNIVLFLIVKQNRQKTAWSKCIACCKADSLVSSPEAIPVPCPNTPFSRSDHCPVSKRKVVTTFIFLVLSPKWASLNTVLPLYIVFGTWNLLVLMWLLKMLPQCLTLSGHMLALSESTGTSKHPVLWHKCAHPERALQPVQRAHSCSAEPLHWTSLYGIAVCWPSKHFRYPQLNLLLATTLWGRWGKELHLTDTETGFSNVT